MGCFIKMKLWGLGSKPWQRWSLLLFVSVLAVVWGLLYWNGVLAGPPQSQVMNFYDLKVKDINGQEVLFSGFRGRMVLLVNTATGCGLAPQLKELQELQNRYADRLVVVGIPTSDFLGQEPLSGSKIAEHCQRNYGVEFLILAKGTLKGPAKDPVLRWLTSKSLNGSFSSRILWNYQKYLVDEQGRLVDWFSPWTAPSSSKLRRLIEKP